jgi:hypothetical protein
MLNLEDPTRILNQAAKDGNVSVVQLLLANPILCDKIEYSHEALNIASERGHLSIVHLLLSNPTMFSRVINLYRALDNATKQGHEDIVRLLLAKIDLKKNAKSIYSLDTAVAGNRLNIVNLFLAEPDFLKGPAPDFLAFPLITAATNNYSDILQAMLSNEVLIGRIGEEQAGDILYKTAEKGCAEMIQLLLGVLAKKITLRDMEDALCRAAYEGHLEATLMIYRYIGVEYRCNGHKQDTMTCIERVMANYDDRSEYTLERMQNLLERLESLITLDFYPEFFQRQRSNCIKQQIQLRKLQTTASMPAESNPNHAHMADIDTTAFVSSAGFLISSAGLNNNNLQNSSGRAIP